MSFLNNEKGRSTILLKLLLVLFVGFTLFIVGSFTAIFPQLSARLMIIPLFFIMIFLAVLNRTDRLLTDRFLKLWLAVLLGTMALWPTYLIVKFGALPAIDARRIVAGFSLAALFFYVISRKQIFRALFQENIGSLRIGSLLIAAYTFWRIISCFTSPSPIASLNLILWEILYYYSMFFVGALFFSRKSLHDWSMTVFMVLAVLVSLYAGIEWMMQKNLLLKFAPTNEAFSEFQVALSIERIRDGVFRAQSTFEHPLLLAEFSAMAVCFGMAAMLWQHNNPSFRVLGGITLATALVAALLTGSRSALVNVAVGGGLVFLLRLFTPKQRVLGASQFLRKFSIMIVLLIAVAVALPTIALLVEGKSRLEATSTEARVQMLKLGLPSIQKYPLLGTGPGSAGTVAGIRTGAGVTTLDNYFLAIAIESGVPALLLLLACLLYPVWVIFNRLMSGNQDSVQLFAAILACMVVTTLTHMVLWMPYNMFFTYLFTGVVLATTSISNRKVHV